ncbi:MAG: SprB repeat-containing protein [Bacteroidetes bacterium]|nr:SprB repeat-containing protein [Bacteroidota bacterium]
MQLSATIKNVGYTECTGIYTLYYVDNSNMEVLIGQRNLSLDSSESISFTIPWFVADQRTTLIGRLMNAVPVEFNTDDNEYEIPIGQLHIAAYSLPASCAHDGTGLAVVNVAGGMPPYFIQWSTGEHTDSIRGLSGTYIVGVSDAENNTLFDTIAIECSSYANDINYHAILSEGFSK